MTLNMATSAQVIIGGVRYDFEFDLDDPDATTDVAVRGDAMKRETRLLWAEYDRGPVYASIRISGRVTSANRVPITDERGPVWAAHRPAGPEPRTLHGVRLALAGNGAGGQVEVDGRDLSNMVSDIAVYASHGEIPVVHLDVLPVGGFSLDARARIILGPTIRQLLADLGWIPPEGDPGGTWATEYVVAAGDTVTEVLELGAGETVDDLRGMALHAGERIACRPVWRGPVGELPHV